MFLKKSWWMDNSYLNELYTEQNFLLHCYTAEGCSFISIGLMEGLAGGLTPSLAGLPGGLTSTLALLPPFK